MYEKSLIILKPDAVQRALTGQIITRFENAGLKLHAMKFQEVSSELARTHYEEHADKPFFPSIESYITAGPVLVFVLGGHNAISKIRSIVGATEPASSAPGTIRGDFAHQAYPAAGEPDDKPIRNLVHASANAEDAEREVKVWFEESELVDYSRVIDEQVSL